MILDWYSVTIQSLQGLWQSFIAFIPLIVGALVIFIIGWFVSMGVGRLVGEILKRLRFNDIFEKGAWKTAMNRAEIKADPAEFIGAIVKWILVIVFLLAAVEILGLNQFATFLTGVLAYLPNVVVAALIFVVTVILVDIVEKVVRAAVESIKVGYGQMVSVIVKWSIWIFSVLAILHQLGIARPFMETLFTGIVAVIVISFGLAFGLGGKDTAADLLSDLRKKLRS